MINVMLEIERLLNNEYIITRIEDESGYRELSFEYIGEGESVSHKALALSTRNNSVKDIMKILYNNRDVFDKSIKYDEKLKKIFEIYKEFWSDRFYKVKIESLLEHHFLELRKQKLSNLDWVKVKDIDEELFLHDIDHEKKLAYAGNTVHTRKTVGKWVDFQDIEYIKKREIGR